MCEVISLPIENKNYRFLYFRANDKDRPIFEVWSSSKDELERLCKYLSILKKPNQKIRGCYAECRTGAIKKCFAPIPKSYIRQDDGNYHIYIEL